MSDIPENQPEDVGEDAAEAPGEAARGERIAKWLARAGVASRRDAERMIAEARVRLDNRVVETPATFVKPGDLVTVDGNPVSDPQRTRLFRYNKPDGLLTTHKDPEGRPTVFEKLPPGLPRVVSVGRLDYNSEGLLLLTNDGALARRLELPANGWIRRYRVRVHGTVNERDLAALARGVTVEGVRYGPIEAGLDSRQGANAWLTVALQEGKNREVRRIMQHLGLQVTRLIRTAYGPFQLGSLPRGGVEEVNPKVLREQLGAGAAPAPARPARQPPAPPPGPAAEPPPRSPRRPLRGRNAGEPEAAARSRAARRGTSGQRGGAGAKGGPGGARGGSRGTPRPGRP
jgi:23S rRNA pseudouridine2605 synthase